MSRAADYTAPPRGSLGKSHWLLGWQGRTQGSQDLMCPFFFPTAPGANASLSKLKLFCRASTPGISALKVLCPGFRTISGCTSGDLPPSLPSWEHPSHRTPVRHGPEGPGYGSVPFILYSSGRLRSHNGFIFLNLKKKVGPKQFLQTFNSKQADEHWWFG